MRTRTWSVCLLVYAGLACAVSVESWRARNLTHELDLAAGTGQRLRALREENRTLERSAIDPMELERLKAEQSEVESLTAEIKALREAEQGAAPKPGSRRTLVSDCVYAGRKTPGSSFESVLWAASRGNVDQLSDLIDLTGKARETADALFNNLPPASRQEYSNPRKVVATLLAASFPKDAVATSSVGERESANDAYLSIQVEHAEGKARLNLYHFRKEEDGWRLLVPEGVMADFEKTLTGDSALLQQAHS